MMRQMRENTKWIMLVTAIAFVALMVFEWGMDITGQSGAGFGELGQVNGTPVTYEQYQAAYRNLYDQVSRGQEEPITSAQNREIEEAAWTEIVNQILIQQELGRRGVRVTDQEVREAARFSPPQELIGDPLFQTDGQFDIQRYQDFLANSADDLFLLQLEAYYREIIPRSKLLRQVTSGIYFTEAELWEQYRFANEQVRVRFVAFNPADRFSDLSVELSEKEIRDYYDANREDFGIPAQVDVKYVALTKAPLQEDTVEAHQRAIEIRQELLDGTDFGEVALRESSDEATAASGGELGTFGRGQMVPVFDSVVFNAPLNQVLEPIRTNFGFHIIEVLSRQGDSAKARHILVPVERTGESEIRLLTLADSLEVLGESMTVSEAARILNVPVGQQVMTELFPFLAGAGQISDGLDWAFGEASPGDVSPVFEDQQAFYMMELVTGTPAGVQPLDNARPTIDRFLRLEKMVAMARAEAEELVERARAAGTLEVLGGQDRLAVQEAGPNARPEFFPGLGYQNKAIGAAFGLELNQISDPVVTNSNVFLIQTLDKIPADSVEWEGQKDLQRAQSVFTVQRQRLDQWISAMRETAEIVDRREQVFQTPRGQGAPTGGLF
ncbi:MAG: peptidylprolyl isomerase [Gemmatimonadota bacterium]